MVTMLGPAIDPTSAGPAEVCTTAGPLLAPEPPFFPPDHPDEPEVWEPLKASEPYVCQVVLEQVVSGDAIGELVTAEVLDWAEDVEMLVGTAATVVASVFDPLWAEVAMKSWIGHDGYPQYQWDPSGYRMTIYMDGVRRWSGIFRQPIRISKGEVALTASDPGVQFAERILGRAEQVDLLDDKGSFETYTSIAQMVTAGWFFPAGVDPTLVTDGVRGTKALRLEGEGWVRSPRITVMGAQGYSRIVDGFVFGKWSDAIPAGEPVANARTSGTAFGAPVYDEAYTLAKAASRPDSGSGWTEDPVGFAARLAPTATAQRAWFELRSFAAGTSTYDLGQLRLSESTGFPPGTTRDYVYYIERVLQALASRAIGGSPTGLSIRIENLTGNHPPQAIRWSHAAAASVRDILMEILGADGGPECQITPGWVVRITDRLGSDRNDISLTVHDILEPELEIDPGAQVTDFTADTGRGNGVSRIAATVAQDFDELRLRIVRIVTAPDMSLNGVTEWAARQARTAARYHATSEVPVPMSTGEELVTGDTVRAVVGDGDLGASERMRVIRRQWRPREGVMMISLGATDE